MPPGIASAVFALGILWLFILDRNRESRTSPALWIPIVWLSIGLSRSVSQWLAIGPMMNSPDQYLDGSPLDRLIFSGMLATGLIVLAVRGRQIGLLLQANWPLLVFLAYCAFSILWSDYPFVAFKRWTKALGDLVMVLIVLTEPDPRDAIKRLLAYTGFLLIPLSVLLIKYYPSMARGFNPFNGMAENVGVSFSKNGLGMNCLFLGLGSLWRFLTVLRSAERPHMTGSLTAHGVVLAMALWLFWMADSATALGCFFVGGFLIAFTSLRLFVLKPMAMHFLLLGIIFLCVFGIVINASSGLVQMVGRDATLTGRTDVWADLFLINTDPWFGTGFESFWLGDRIKMLWAKYWWHPTQAHNGYIEIYLNLGWVGVVLLGFVIAWGYRNLVAVVHRDPGWGGLRLAYFIAVVLYNLTEAAFKAANPVWIVFLLAIAVIPEPLLRKDRIASQSEPSQLRHLGKLSGAPSGR